MFRKYHRQFWKRSQTSRGRRGLFNPENITMKQIDAIDERIESREKIEQNNFDKAFAVELAKL